MHAEARRGARPACRVVLVSVLLALVPPARASDHPIPESSTPARVAAAADAPSARSAWAELGTFDCDRLTVGITLDNTGSTRTARYGYSTTFLRPLHEPYAGDDGRVDVEVAAGEARVVELPLRDDARTTVIVHLPDGRRATWESTCGNAPGAIFGPSDCAALRLGVMLDNRTSSTPTRYRWAVGDPAGLLAAESVEVDAGAVTQVDVPLVADGWTSVEVGVDGRGRVATLNRQACGWIVLDPRAGFGVVDCQDVSVPVILDNSRTTTRLRFHLPGDDVVLGPGESRSLRLHLPIRELLAVTVDDVLPRGRSVVRAVTSTAHCAAAAADAVASTGAAVTTADPAAAGGGPAAAAPVAASGSKVDTADAPPASATVVGARVLVVLVALALLVVIRRRRRATAS